MLQRLNLGTAGNVQERNGRLERREKLQKKKKGRETLVSSRHELEPKRTELATYKTEPKRADGKGEGNRQDSENGRVWVEGQWRRRFTYDILTIQIV